MNEELRSRLKKIQALAERGVGGEKISAEKKLKKLLADNNLTEEDLNETETHYYLFSYSGAPYLKPLLGQIIYKVIGYNDGNGIAMYKSKHTRNKYGIYCTPAQKVEIDLEFEFYSNLFAKEVDLLLNAFIQKQDLFPEDGPTSSINLNNMAPQEKEEYRKMVAFAKNMDKRSRPLGMIEDHN